MKITKKEIREKTESTRGTGFNPKWRFVCQIEPGVNFSKSYLDERVVNCQSGQTIGGPAKTKADFVNVIYDALN